MLARWKVTHRFSDGVNVRNPITAYQNIRVSLFYDGNKLMRIEHELDCDDKFESCQVINTSKEQLKLFWELLQYRRGIPLPNINSVAKMVQPANGSPPKITGFADVAIRALICSPVDMPKPRVFSDAPSRLLVWLRLANNASDSDDAAYAIRNYYMIWEDLEIADWPNEAKELKLVRHFVSHAKIDKKRNDLLGFVERNLGKHIEQYDPTDEAQQKFVTSYSRSARKLIETELDKLL